MDKLLLEQPWLPKVVELSKAAGLDWLLMACLALELSAGDPRCRNIDREFVSDQLGPDSPLFSKHWEDGIPSVKLVDLGTRWGLFQILGRVAEEKGYFTGRLVNFTDIGANTRAACEMFSNVIQEGGTEEDAIRYFGAEPDRVYKRMQESRDSVEILLHIGVPEESVEQ